MNIYQTLYSKEDWSTNFIFDNMLEARYVRRVLDYFIIYLSSHNGCNKACRFCHLTQTKQTSFEHTDLDNYLKQAKAVLQHYDNVKKTQGIAERVNFNFMARGEALANNLMLNKPHILFDALNELLDTQALTPTFNISTIMPTEIKDINLTKLFQDVTQKYVIYYSLYSVDEQFRKRWLPKALPVSASLQKLKEWQDSTGHEIALHWAFIEGQNDSEKDVMDIINTIKPYNLKAKFNLVRYNPYSINQGKESSEEVLQRNFDLLSEALGSPVSRIVPRVGFDVKASCGMFIQKLDK